MACQGLVRTVCVHNFCTVQCLYNGTECNAASCSAICVQNTKSILENIIGLNLATVCHDLVFHLCHQHVILSWNKRKEKHVSTPTRLNTWWRCCVVTVMYRLNLLPTRDQSIATWINTCCRKRDDVFITSKKHVSASLAFQKMLSYETCF